MLIVFFIILTFSYASNIFTGQIIDADSNSPLSNVNIQVGGELGTVSDQMGFFLFSDIESGLYTLTISHIGYEKISKSISIPEFNKSVIELKKTSIDHSRIVVTGSRISRHIKDTPVLTHVISNEDIKNSSYISVKDMLEIIMPNVQSVASNHNDDKVKIQGLDNKYLTFLIDGDRVSGEYAGNIDFSMLNLNNVEKIEIVEGGMSTLYGSGSIGGVVNIITKNNFNPYWSNISYLYDDPLIITKSIDLGFNKKFNKNIFSYSVGFIDKSSDGYDLTPQSEFSRTLEENFNKTLQHSIGFNLSNNTDVKLQYKDYESEATKYRQEFIMSVFDDVTIKNSPLSRYVDNSYKLKINHNFSDKKKIKLVLNNERYTKYYYYPYYYETLPYSSIPLENGVEFKQGELSKKELLLQYQKKSFLVGLEYSFDGYSSYNIYDNSGNLSVESIFSGSQEMKKNIQNSVFCSNTININDENELTAGLRITPKEGLFHSFSFLKKLENNYNIRFSLSNGYRRPSLKELYYEWTDHVPNIYGNPDLKTTINNYYSISFDKRTYDNDFSANFYYNDVQDMITTEYINGDLHYTNFDKVYINGINIHYSRNINSKSKVKFVYNYTNTEADSDEIVEGVSKHSFRMNLMQNLYQEKLKMILSANYCGEKNNYDQELYYLKELEDYWILDVVFVLNIFESVNFKFGVKNALNYKDDSRFDLINSNVLSSYDPGKRYFFQFNLNFSKKGE